MLVYILGQFRHYNKFIYINKSKKQTYVKANSKLIKKHERVCEKRNRHYEKHIDIELNLFLKIKIRLRWIINP